MQKAGFSTIHRYIIYEFIFSFFVAFVFFFFIFFVNQLLLLAEEILSKNVSLKNVLLIIFYSIPAISSFTFPFASLVGGLMAVSRLSSDNEMLAFQVSGVRYSRLFLPLFLVGLVLSSFSFAINDYFLPLSTVKFGKLYREILYSTPELELESYAVKKYKDSTIITGDVSGNTINNLVIIDRTNKKDKRVITADSAKLVPSGLQKGISSMELSNVTSIIPKLKQEGKFSFFSSERMIYNILLKNITFSLKTLTPREMSSVDIYKGIVEKKNKLKQKKEENKNELGALKSRLFLEFNPFTTTKPHDQALNSYVQKISSLEKKIFFDRSLQVYELEFNKKFSVTFACIIFIFFSFPVSLYTKKSGRSVGFGLGLLVSVFYWSMLFVGQTLGIRISLSPVVAMWTPNIIILLIGTYLMFRRLRI